MINDMRTAVKGGSGSAATSEYAESAGNAARDDQDGAGAAGMIYRRRRKKFVGVRQRPSGRWVAEIKDTTQKIRMWLGTFDTAECAARAYDEAACLLRGSHARTNFIRPAPAASSPSSSSPLASRLSHMLRARQSRHAVSESSSVSSYRSAAGAATMQPCCSGNPLEFAPSPINPSVSSTYSHNRNPSPTMQSSNDPPKHYPNGANSKQNVNPHPSYCPHNSPQNPSDGNRQQHAPILNHGNSSHFLHPNTDQAQSDIFGFPSTKSSKANNCRLCGSSLCESESSGSDLSPHMTHGKHIMWTHHSHHHNNREGGFMDALMGINDDIILKPSEHMEGMTSSSYNNQIVCPLDFNVEASLGSIMMQVDEFPLISELSFQLEEAEGGLNHYANQRDEEGRIHSSH